MTPWQIWPYSKTAAIEALLGLIAHHLGIHTKHCLGRRCKGQW